MARLELDGVGDLLADLKRIGEGAAGRGAERAVRDAGDILRDAASDRAPRGPTGNLARGIISKVDKDRGSWRARVGPSRRVFYGRFVELGEGHQPAQPFLRPAFDAERRRMIEAMRDAVDLHITGRL